MDQHLIILNGWINHLSVQNLHQELENYANFTGAEALTVRTIQRWYSKFEEGDFDFEEHRGGSHKEVKTARIPQNINAVRNMLEVNTNLDNT